MLKITIRFVFKTTFYIFKFFYKVFGFLIPKKYQAIDSCQVAAAMLHFAAAYKSGKFIHESVELLGFQVPDFKTAK